MYPDEVSVIALPTGPQNDDKDKTKSTKRNTPEEKNISYITLFGCFFAVVAFCTVLFVPQTLIPRNNSMFYQACWFEIFLPAGVFFLVDAGFYVLGFVLYFGYEAKNSCKIFLKIYAFEMILLVGPCVIGYFIWCNYLGYNWPIPYLGYVNLIIWVALPVGIWISVSDRQRDDKEFRRNMKLFALFLLDDMLMFFLREKTAILFQVIPSNLQWLIAFIIPILKYCEKLSKSKLITKMTGGTEEASNVWLAISINVYYANFVALRIFNAEPLTVVFFVAIDFILQLQITYKIIHCHKKTGAEKDENGIRQKSSIVRKLVLAEITEAISPIVFSIGFAMAYYGPNSTIIGNNPK